MYDYLLVIHDNYGPKAAYLA